MLPDSRGVGRVTTLPPSPGSEVRGTLCVPSTLWWSGSPSWTEGHWSLGSSSLEVTPFTSVHVTLVHRKFCTLERCTSYLSFIPHQLPTPCPRPIFYFLLALLGISMRTWNACTNILDFSYITCLAGLFGNQL